VRSRLELGIYLAVATEDKRTIGLDVTGPIVVLAAPELILPEAVCLLVANILAETAR
jgi:hypothetical protein